MKRFLVISSILILAACNTGLEINTECVLKHTAEMVKFENTAVDIEETFVNLSWTWVYATPNGDGVIVERKISSDYDSIAYVDSITALMTFTDTSDLLESNLPVSYRLGFLVGKSVDYFVTTDFTIPGTRHFVQPDTEFITITNDTLIIEFAVLAGFDETDIAIYKTFFTDIDSIINTPIEELLQMLTDPVKDTTLTNTIWVVAADTALIEPLTVHMIKISSSKIGELNYITDTSIGLRAFIRTP